MLLAVLTTSQSFVDDDGETCMDMASWLTLNIISMNKVRDYEKKSEEILSIKKTSIEQYDTKHDEVIVDQTDWSYHLNQYDFSTKHLPILLSKMTSIWHQDAMMVLKKNKQLYHLIMVLLPDIISMNITDLRKSNFTQTIFMYNYTDFSYEFGGISNITVGVMGFKIISNTVSDSDNKIDFGLVNRYEQWFESEDVVLTEPLWNNENMKDAVTKYAFLELYNVYH